jgi:hypothetical protein
MTPRLALIAAIAAFSGIAVGEPTLKGFAPAAERVVAIGDVHGSADHFVAILTRAGLIDAQRKWSGGKTTFVQTGDTTDRGAGVREIFDLLMALEKQAAAAGGKVQVVLGNHEVMNLVNDLRDVSPEAIASFGGEDGYRKALSKDGEYGKWLRRKPILAKVDDGVFMHAGIDLDFSKESLDDLNRRAQREIAEWDAGVRWMLDKKLIDETARFAAIVTAARGEIERLNALAAAKDKTLPADAPKTAAMLLPLANIPSSSLFNPQGPLWFRGFATWADAEGAAKMEALLKHHRVKRFVTGHTVQRDGRITPRFNEALFLIDTGMLGGKFWPAGRPSALEIVGERVNPLYVE